MAYAALTIDANVVYGQSFDFDHGLLGQLRQFAQSEAEFVLSDIVREELRRKMREMARASSDRLKSTVREGQDRGVLPTAQNENAEALLQALLQPNVAADLRLVRFARSTGAVIVSSETVTGADLSRLYFGALPPFETTGAKKAEFPDAIALLALEGWAKEHGRILAVSSDRGWRDYAATSEYIDVVDDLGEALAVFQAQDPAQAAVVTVTEMFRRMAVGELQGLSNSLRARLEGVIESAEFTPEATAYQQLEMDLAGVQVHSIDFPPNFAGDYDVTVVRLEDETVVFTLPITADLSVETHFVLNHWDSIDREYIRIDSQDIQSRQTLDLNALITFTGNLQNPDELEIDEVELTGFLPEIDYGEIEPDFGDYD